MVQYHITGINTTNFNEVNNILNTLSQLYPNASQTSYNIVDNTTLDVFFWGVS